MGTITWALTSLAAALLVVAGIPKLAGRSTVPLVPRSLHRVVGAMEVLSGGYFLVAPNGWSAALVCAAYTLLAAALLVAILRREPDCGCFGVVPVPPEWGHLAVNVVLAAAAAAATLSTTWSRPDAWMWAISVLLSLVGAAMLAELLSTGTALGRIVRSLEANR